MSDLTYQSDIIYYRDAIYREAIKFTFLKTVMITVPKVHLRVLLVYFDILYEACDWPAWYFL